MKKVSIVTPLFNEEKTVDELIHRLQTATKELDYDFEFVLVDDGSSDRTLEKLIKWKSVDPRLKIIKLSRNWGFQNAYTAGLNNAKGDAIILMDGDLQDPPELIHKFLVKWREGYDVVYSTKTKRQDSLIKRLAISIFYRLYKQFSKVSIENQAGMFSLIDRRVANELINCKEKSKFYVGLRSFVGFRQTMVSYERQARYAGKPRQSLRKLINLALNAFFSFSFLPIRLLTYFGLLTLFLSIFAIFAMIFIHFAEINIFLFSYDPRLTSIIVLILFGYSLQIIFLGIIGEYIARIFDEVRERPYYIVDKIIE